MTRLRPLRATYRLQLNADFGFGQAAATAPYLAQLGVSHCYLSPILAAQPGSTHGYDIIDHSRLNPELGTRADFDAMVAAMHAHDIGILLDIVPNHMAVEGSGNHQWLDVLRHGEASAYASWFDIDWAAPGADRKVVLPVLGATLVDALREGALTVKADEDGGSIWAYDRHRLPLDPATTDGHAGDDIAALIERQHWRVIPYWEASERLNYRRFFAVSGLAGLRIERDDVFEPTHRLNFELVDAGLVDGLRIDHIDGLVDPSGYLDRLRQRVPQGMPILVEKILAECETLPGNWPVEGTTGYEFGALTTRLLVDARAIPILDASVRTIAGRDEAFSDIQRTSKLEIIDTELTAEVRRLARSLHDARPTISVDTAFAILRLYLAALDVYRDYDQPDPRRTAAVDRALAAARDAASTPEKAEAADILAALLRDGETSGADEFLARLGQVSGAVMAKGVEDTAFYRYPRLLSLNEVGGSPAVTHAVAADFHAFAQRAAASAPFSLLGTSTHDTKRAEDARHRITALSWRAEDWQAAAGSWVDRLGAPPYPIVHPEDRYTLLQLLVGLWPAEAPAGDEAERLSQAMIKSVREARLHSSWLTPDAAYEERITALVDAVLAPDDPLGAEIKAFIGDIADDAARLGLVDVVLKLTAPGVPDIYQGTELWAHSLVDPDNRLPVDYELRQRLLGAGDWPALEARWANGAIKQRIIANLLGFRRDHAALFAEGAYHPLSTDDDLRTLAFLRRHGNEALVVIVPLDRLPRGQIALPELPADLSGRPMRDVLGDRLIEAGRVGVVSTLRLFGGLVAHIG